MKFSKIICLFFVVRFVETLPVPTPTSPQLPTDTTLQFTDSHDTTRGYDVTSSLPQSVDVTDELNTTSFEEELTFDDGSGDVLDLESIVVERLLPSRVPLFEEETQTVENLRESDTSTSLFDIQDELVNTTDQSTGTYVVTSQAADDFTSETTLNFESSDVTVQSTSRQTEDDVSTESFSSQSEGDVITESISTKTEDGVTTHSASSQTEYDVTMKSTSSQTEYDVTMESTSSETEGDVTTHSASSQTEHDVTTESFSSQTQNDVTRSIETSETIATTTSLPTRADSRVPSTQGKRKSSARKSSVLSLVRTGSSDSASGTGASSSIADQSNSACSSSAFNRKIKQLHNQAETMFLAYVSLPSLVSVIHSYLYLIKSHRLIYCS